jgi:hypothetical protein
MKLSDGFYPVQRVKKGAEKDFTHSILAADVADAEDWFVDAKERLLHVNRWTEHSDLTTSRFSLTDSHGNEVGRSARKGDYIKIETKGQGSDTFDLCEWAHIEAIIYDDYPDQDMETFTLVTRPVTTAVGKLRDAMDIPSGGSRGSFIIERQGRKLFAACHSDVPPAAEQANTGAALRNAAAAASAWMGLSDTQWKNLVQGMID